MREPAFLHSRQCSRSRVMLRRCGPVRSRGDRCATSVWQRAGAEGEHGAISGATIRQSLSTDSTARRPNGRRAGVEQIAALLLVVVVAWAAVEGVVAVAACEGVVAVVALQVVVAVVALQVVVAGAAVEFVCARAAGQGVVVGAADDGVVTCIALLVVVALAALLVIVA